jgi:hypothetical protein
MASEYPLLDLRDLWRAAHRALEELYGTAECLFADSEQTWRAVAHVAAAADAALQALGTLPPAILEDIAKDEADLQEWEEKTA